MSDKDDKIIERIRQLLAMAADTSSPHEASIAAGRARKLMDMHQVSMADLKDEETGFGFMRVDKAYRFVPEWKSWLCVAVAKFNDCKAIKGHEYKVEGSSSYSYRLMFQGYDTDVIVAAAMYDYLSAAIDRMCAKYIAELGYDKYPAKIGDAYKKEASAVIGQRLRAMLADREKDMRMSTGTSLIVVKLRAVEEKFGAARYASSKPRRVAGEDQARAAQRGREDGHRISINTQIGPDEKRSSLN